MFKVAFPKLMKNESLVEEKICLAKNETIKGQFSFYKAKFIPLRLSPILRLFFGIKMPVNFLNYIKVLFCFKV